MAPGVLVSMAQRRIEAEAPSARAWISAARNCEVSPRVVWTSAAYAKAKSSVRPSGRPDGV